MRSGTQQSDKKKEQRNGFITSSRRTVEARTNGARRPDRWNPRDCGCGTDESTAGITLVASETLASADTDEKFGYALDGGDVTLDSPTLTVQTGREVTLTLENRAGQYSKVRRSHDFAVVPALDDSYTDIDLFTDIATLKIDDKVLWGARTEQIFTDDSATIAFVPDAPGTYQYICTIPGHAKQGMTGTFVVENPEEVSTAGPEAATVNPVMPPRLRNLDHVQERVDPQMVMASPLPHRAPRLARRSGPGKRGARPLRAC